MVGRETARRQFDSGDDFVGAKVVVALRRVARQPMEVARTQWRARPLRPATCTVASSAASATHMSEGCVAMQWSLAPRIACMRLNPPMAAQPLPGFALVAGRADIVEVVAARALHQVAAGRAPCCAAAARRRPGSRSTAPDSAAATTRVVGDVGVGAQARRSAGRRRRSRSTWRQRQPVDVDQLRRALDIHPSSGRRDWCRRR